MEACLCGGGTTVKRTRLIVAAILVTAGLIGCMGIPVEGRYSYLRGTDFSELNSFALLETPTGVFSTPESTERYRTGMVRALSSKGFTENKENPDFVIRTAPVETYREVYTLSGNIVIPTAMLRVTFEVPNHGDESYSVYEAAAYAYYQASWSQEEKDTAVDDAIAVILKSFPPSE